MSAPILIAFAFNSFLELLSQPWGDDLAVLQVDQATAHTAHSIIWPSHSFPTFQPSHCPELNPIERFGLVLKKPLAWQNGLTREALRPRLAAKLAAIASETIASLTAYNFILEALFGAASY